MGSRLKFNIITLKAVGIVAAVGDSVKNLKVGTPAAIMTFGSYAEYTMVTTLIYRSYYSSMAEMISALDHGYDLYEFSHQQYRYIRSIFFLFQDQILKLLPCLHQD